MGWTRFFRRRYWDDERARELDAYLQIETDDNVARGMPPAEARAAAQRRLGNATRVREEIYEMNTLTWLEQRYHDLRYGARVLARNPTFAAVAILTLALGTGANTAMFQVMNAVWLRPLPVERPEQLVSVELVPHKGGRSGSRTGRYSVLSVPEWEQIRTRQHVFSSAAVWGTAFFNIARGGPMQLVEGIWASGAFFDTVGVQAWRGRLLTPADDRRGCGSPGVVLSYAFWQRQFGGEPVIGRPMSLDGHPVEILGITPPAFTGIEVGRSFDVAAPLCAVPLLEGPPDPYTTSTLWFLDAIGRLAPGMSVQQASARLGALSPAIYHATLPATYDAEDRQGYLALTLTAVPAGTGVSTLRDAYQTPVWILLGITGLVLLIACANLANLMLARATTRVREISVRLAIGASRRRIVEQLVAESLLVAVLGTAAGLLVARWSSAALVALIARGGTALSLDVAFDARVFGFAIGIAVLACLIFGLTPALRATAVDPGTAMKVGARGTTEAAGRFTLRSSLVVVQVALSLVLVVGALLFARTARNLATQPMGFQPRHVLVAALDLTPANVPADPSAMFHERLLSRIRALPGVEAAAEVSVLPIDGSGWNDRVVVDGREAQTLPMFNAITPGYFDVMQTPIAIGRDFQRADAIGPLAAIVNETFARRYLGSGDPLGRTFDVVTPVGTPRPRYTIVGVVKDSKYSSLRQPLLPIAYLDMDQRPADDSSPHLMVRSGLALPAITGEITRTMAKANPEISLRYRTMESVIDAGLSRERLMAILSGVFGGLAALIAMLGLYGVMSYAVARRRVEIGIRMALGAEAASVLRMVLRQAGALLAAGLLIGGVLAIAAARTAASLLYGIQPWDPLTLGASMAGLAIVGALATWLPARRASHVDPTVALRQD
ncbi:MAG TPA: ABC transporter permease [Vicinamibacterales bacterium]|nr:ABC transporter permease [Vicinamibacterales bacterium]